MIDLESKRKKYDKLIKVVVTLLIGLVFGPIALVAVGGLAGLVFAWVVSETVICFTPWMSMKFANWKLKAIKAEAEANPLETLENQYREKEQGLVAFKQHIEQLHAETRNVYEQIRVHREQFPDAQSSFEPIYDAMIVALNDRVAKYKQVQASLKKFERVIEQKRSEFKVALALSKARKAAGIGEDFMSKLVADTAINAVTERLNLEFAALETSILDSPSESKVTFTNKPTAQIPQHAGPPTLDLEFDEVVTEQEPATVNRR